MAQHKWHKEIKAWADGAEIQYKHQFESFKWSDCGNVLEPPWGHSGVNFRVKPTKPAKPAIGTIDRVVFAELYGCLAIELTPEVIEALKVANIEY